MLHKLCSWNPFFVFSTEFSLVQVFLRAHSEKCRSKALRKPDDNVRRTGWERPGGLPHAAVPAVLLWNALPHARIAYAPRRNGPQHSSWLAYHNLCHIQEAVSFPTVSRGGTREDCNMRCLGLLMAQVAKNLHAMQETRLRSLGQEDPLEKGIATHSSILAWRIPWTEELGGLRSMGLQKVEHD